MVKADLSDMYRDYIAYLDKQDRPDTIRINQVDQGQKICLSISEAYAHERKYLFSVLKLLYYQHGLRRLDLKARDPHAFWSKNLLVMVGEEFQDVVTSSVGGMSDYAVSRKIREANVALIVLTQSYLSLLPPHANKDQANVLVLNLRNRMIFRAADAECAKQSAEIQDIEKLIRQSGELSDSLIRLARKLQERNRHRAQLHEERAQNLATLHRKLNDLSSHIDHVNNELGFRQYYNQDEAYVKARVAVVDGTATPQEAVVELLRAGVTDKSMSPDFAVEQLAKLLRQDLPVSRRIEIRETAKAAFEAGDDVLGKVRPFLKEPRWR